MAQGTTPKSKKPALERSPAGTLRRLALTAATAATLAACATTQQPQPDPAPVTPVTLGEPTKPPFDPNDPWRDHIQEASERFDVPEAWIRAVMRRESGGRAFASNGRPLRSPAGAIGLMQVMPATYEYLRWRHDLGPDVSDPRDNVLAGTAYLREMYDLFGSPGFLAAYNCGPGCYQAVQEGRQRLPRETQAYLAALTPAVIGREPSRPDLLLGGTMLASAEPPASPGGASVSAPTEKPVQLAMAEIPPPSAKPERNAPASPPTASGPVPATKPVLVADAGPAGRTAAAPDETEAQPHQTSRTVFRFVTQGDWSSCGSLQGRSVACIPADLAGSSGRSS